MTEAVSDAQGFEFVDTHVHQWDVTNHPWYPALQADPDDEASKGLGDMAGLRRDFLAEEYRSESVGYHVTKIVHISAVSAPGTHLEESRWLEDMGRATGWPAAIIGTVDADGTPESWAEELEEQSTNGPLFRGIRMLDGLDFNSSRSLELLTMLAERDLIFDMVTNPSRSDGDLSLLRQVPTLNVVVEHCGWPEGTGREDVARWRDAMDALASIGDRVLCKLSGIAMATHSIELSDIRPWIEDCIAFFGSERCFFGSNFPVDGLYGSYSDLLGSYRRSVADLDAHDQHRLFVQNAEDTYRI